MEAFQPAAGSVVTFGYDDLGSVRGVSIDVRELKDSRGADVRGLLVKVTENEYHKESAFVDADEIPELLKGFDALLAVNANPTQFKSFEVRYTTRGGLQLTAFNGFRDGIAYAVQAGRITKAQALPLSADDMRKVRALFESAQQKLASLGPSRR